MGGSNRRCIGGITNDGKSVRLLTSAGHHWEATAPFQVGQVWDVTFAPTAALVPPHVEDVLVANYAHIGEQSELRAHLLTRVAPWQGDIDELFGGVLGYTANNNGYVSVQLGVPPLSTWFWIPDQDLLLRDDGKHYDYHDGSSPRGLAYVGEATAPPVLAAGTLIRVSLARWWGPDDREERCYLQLSGWYT